MFKAIMTVLLIVLLAGTAIADKVVEVPSHLPSLTKDDGLVFPNDPVYTLAYDFCNGPISYAYYGLGGTVFGDEGVLPPGAQLVGFGVTGIYADINSNPGAAFSNWASELFIGYSYWDGVSVQYVGIRPFSGVNEGPGSFGPADDFYITGADIAAIDPNFVVLPPMNSFTFYASADYDDGTGMDAGTVTCGMIWVEIESAVVSVESETLDAVKALYR